MAELLLSVRYRLLSTSIPYPCAQKCISYSAKRPTLITLVRRCVTCCTDCLGLLANLQEFQNARDSYNRTLEGMHMTAITEHWKAFWYIGMQCTIKTVPSTFLTFIGPNCYHANGPIRSCVQPPQKTCVQVTSHWPVTCSIRDIGLLRAQVATTYNT